MGWVWPAVAVLLLAQAAVLALWPEAHLLMIDLQVYRAGGEHVLAGVPLYDGGVLLDLRSLDPEILADLDTRAQGALHAAAREVGVNVRLERVGDRPGGDLGADALLTEDGEPLQAEAGQPLIVGA